MNAPGWYQTEEAVGLDRGQESQFYGTVQSPSAANLFLLQAVEPISGDTPVPTGCRGAHEEKEREKVREYRRC